jgi:hypothetical protein
MKQMFTFTLLILAIGLAAFEYDVIDELAMGGVYDGDYGIEVDFPYLYAVSLYGLDVFEIHPMDGSISSIGNISISGEAISIVKIDDVLYLLKRQRYFADILGPSEIVKIDISEPHSPMIMMSQDLDVSYHPSRIYTIGSVLAFENKTDLATSSISLMDPETLLVIDEVDCFYGYSKISETQMIALIDPEEQLYTIHDFSDPYNHYEIGTTTLSATSATGGFFFRWDDTHIVHLFYDELIMYEVSDVCSWEHISMQPLQSLWFTTNVTRHNDRLLLSTTSSILVIDYSDIESPEFVQNYELEPAYWYPAFISSSVSYWNNHIYWQTSFDGILHLTMQIEGLEMTDSEWPRYPLFYYPVLIGDTMFSISTGGGIDIIRPEGNHIHYVNHLLPDLEVYNAYKWQDTILLLHYVYDSQPYIGFFMFDGTSLLSLETHLINNYESFVINEQEPDIIYLYNSVTGSISRCRISEIYGIEYLYQYQSNRAGMHALQFHDSYLYGVDNLNELCIIGGLPNNAGYEEACLNNPFSAGSLGFTYRIRDNCILVSYGDQSIVGKLYTFNTHDDFEYHADIPYYMDGFIPSKYGDILYLPGWYSLHVYDISDYDNPVHLGYVPLNSQYRDIVFYEENGVEKAIIQQAECLTMVTIQPTETGEPTLPVVECTLGNYPNPFKPAAAGRGPATTIYFETTNAHESAQIEIFNVRGQKVKELKADMSSRPQRRDLSYSTTWDGCDSNGTPVAGGVYLYQLKADGKALGQSKMLLLK